MKVFVLGAGMFVTGRGTDAPGPVLASLAETSRSLAIEEVIVAATAADNASVVRTATERINEALGTKLGVSYVVATGDPGRQARDVGATCAVVAIPDPLHFDAARALLGAGMHVLVVKPLTPTLAEARALVDTARAHNRYGAVEFHKRFDEANLVARRLLSEGKLGDPLYFNVAYSQRIDIPLTTFRAWAARTNIFQYLGVHYVDLIHFLTGLWPARVSALGTRGLLAGQGIDTWDSIHATVTWSSRRGDGPEVVSQFAVNWIDPSSTSAVSDQRYTIVGTAGRIDLDQKHRGVELVAASSGARSINPYYSELLSDADRGLRYQGYGFQSIARFLQDVVAIEAGRTTPADLEGRRPTFTDALPSVAVIEAAHHSLTHQGEWRTIDRSSLG